MAYQGSDSNNSQVAVLGRMGSAHQLAKVRTCPQQEQEFLGEQDFTDSSGENYSLCQAAKPSPPKPTSSLFSSATQHQVTSCSLPPLT